MSYLIGDTYDNNFDAESDDTITGGAGMMLSTVEAAMTGQYI